MSELSDFIYNGLDCQEFGKMMDARQGPTIVALIAAGGGLSGVNYTLLKGNDTPANNYTALQAAYTESKTTTPGGEPLSLQNRYTILLAPGSYYNGDDDLVLDTPYIDIVSLTGNADALCHILIKTDNIHLTGILGAI